MRKLWMLLVVTMTIIGGASAAEENMLKNGALTSADGKVADWTIRQGADTLEADAADKPAGCAGSLRVTVKDADDKLAELVQKIVIAQPGELTLTGWLRSETPGAGVIQVKLYKGRQELKRISTPVSKETWEKFGITFPTGEADRVEIVCRWWRKDRNVGKPVWFAGLTLQPAAAAAPAAK